LEEVVLDSSVIVKAVLKPGSWLPTSIYERELKTHDKARLLVRKLKSEGVTVFLPYPVLVEVAAVLTRIAARGIAERIVSSLKATQGYVIVYEDEIRHRALQVAFQTGSSGFDAYIIALALERTPYS